MPRNLSAPLFILDELIRAGRVAAARRELQSLAKRKLPRESVAPAAFFAWRLKLGKLGAALLHRTVRPPPRALVVATEEEKAVYAACLIQLGATEEGEALLDEVDAKAFPRAHLFRASALVSRWEYREVIPVLEQYVASASTEAYQKLVGRVNLAAAHVFEHEHAAAKRLIDAAAEAARRGKHARLFSNVMELSALSAMMQERWSEAEGALELSEKGLANEGGLDAFLLRKWRVILRLLREPASRATLAALDEIRQQAAKLMHWETVRDCDRYRAIVTRDEAILQRTYFGTPYAGYRAKLLADFGGNPRIPEAFVWDLDRGKTPATYFDLQNARLSRGEASLVAGDNAHRLVTALCQDYYRPVRTAAIHARLYPDDHYNPASSPLRVRQALRRLRRWIESERLPLDVSESDGSYRLRATGAIGIRSALAAPPGSRGDVSLGRLRSRWPQTAFSSKEARALLGLSERAVRALLEEGVTGGDLTRTGRSVAIRYRFGKG